MNSTGHEMVHTANTLLKYLVFQIDGQHYALSINDVLEIIKPQKITEMPQLPSCVKGIIKLREDVIPVIDVNLCLGKVEMPYTERTCIIIVDKNGGNFALVVDEVDDVVDINHDRIYPPPTISGETSGNYITGVAKTDKYFILLLDVSIMIPD